MILRRLLWSTKEEEEEKTRDNHSQSQLRDITPSSRMRSPHLVKRRIRPNYLKHYHQTKKKSVFHPWKVPSDLKTSLEVMCNSHTRESIATRQT